MYKFHRYDDKIINRANETGEDWRELVDNNIATYYRDMDALNILRADSYLDVLSMLMI